MSDKRLGIDVIGVCTGFYCTDGNGQYLFALRTDKCRDEHGKWDCGAGALEWGSGFHENVLREVKEEYGCDSWVIGQLSPQNVIRDHQGVKTHWVAISFIVLVNPDQVVNNEPHKFERLEWFGIDHLPEPLHPSVREQFEKNHEILKVLGNLYNTSPSGYWTRV